ncbi:hypothetical protein GCM10008924_17270 [Gracilibacillus halotolerans]
MVNLDILSTKIVNLSQILLASISFAYRDVSSRLAISSVKIMYDITNYKRSVPAFSVHFVRYIGRRFSG